MRLCVWQQRLALSEKGVEGGVSPPWRTSFVLELVGQASRGIDFCSGHCLPSAWRIVSSCVASHACRRPQCILLPSASFRNIPHIVWMFNTHFIRAVPRANPGFLPLPQAVPSVSPAYPRVWHLCCQHAWCLGGWARPRRVLGSVGKSRGSALDTPESACSALPCLPPVPGTAWSSFMHIGTVLEAILKERIGLCCPLPRNLPASASVLPMALGLPVPPPRCSLGCLSVFRVALATQCPLAAPLPTLATFFSFWRGLSAPGRELVMSVCMCLLSLEPAGPPCDSPLHSAV